MSVKKAKGKSPSDLTEVWKLLNSGKTVLEVSEMYEVTVQTVKNWVTELRKAGYAVKRKGKARRLPHARTVAKTSRAVLEWDDSTIRDFMSDHFDINVDDLDKSIHDTCNDILIRMSAEGVPVREAEKMILGIEWYLNDRTRRFRK